MQRNTLLITIWIRLTEHERVPIGVKYYNPRVSFDGLHWFLIVAVETEVKSAIKPVNQGIGIDLGIRRLAICSDGPMYKNINKTGRVRQIKKKQRRLQRRISRKYRLNKKGEKFQKTRNIIKSEKKLLKIVHRLTNIRTNYIHHVINEIIKRVPSFIVLEDLNVKGMMRNRSRARAIQEEKWGDFYSIMQYKCEWNGINFISANRRYPSSKRCHVCGYIKKDLKPNETIYKCPVCGLVLDRDINASYNLYQYGELAVNQ